MSEVYKFSLEDCRSPPACNAPNMMKFPPNSPKKGVEGSNYINIVTFLYREKVNGEDTANQKLFCVDIDQNGIDNTPHKDFTSNMYSFIDYAASKTNNTIVENAIEELSLQEQLRRERMRYFATGVTTYEYASAFRKEDVKNNNYFNRMLIPMNNSLFLCDFEIAKSEEGHCIRPIAYDCVLSGDNSALKALKANIAGAPMFMKCDISGYDDLPGADIIDPHVSPDGRYIGFICDADLYVLDLSPMHAGDLKGSIQHSVIMRITYNGVGGRKVIDTELPKSTVTCGIAEYIAQEEMNRYRGFWFSPDSSKILYEQAEEAGVDSINLSKKTKGSAVNYIPGVNDTMGDSDIKDLEHHSYPFTGTANAKVILAVVTLSDISATVSTDPSELVVKDTPQWVKVGLLGEHSEDTDVYLARAEWWSSCGVFIQVQNRLQTLQQLQYFDVCTGVNHLVLEESCSSKQNKYNRWININDNMHIFSQGWRPRSVPVSSSNVLYFIWQTELLSGFDQLYLLAFNVDSKQCSWLTETPIGGGGEWIVDSLVAVDEDNEVIYISGNMDCALDLELYRTTLLPTEKEQKLTRITNRYVGTDVIGASEVSYGTNVCVVCPAGEVFINIHSSVFFAPRTEFYTYSASVDMWLKKVVPLTTNSDEGYIDSLHWDNRLDKRLLKFGSGALRDVQFHKFRSLDDKVWLYGCTYAPSFEGYNKLALIDFVYGGPHVQYVANTWRTRVDIRAQRLHQQELNEGRILVFRCDNRGSARRGAYFESALYGDMGNLELLDQYCALQYFKRYFTVPNESLSVSEKAGISGWSYGGYMSSMAMVRSEYIADCEHTVLSSVFTCGVAGAPVTQWTGYDTHYTERYMSVPALNAEGYKESSVVEQISRKRGAVPFVHKRKGEPVRRELHAGQLFILHGLMDENVLYNYHTADLLKRMPIRSLRIFDEEDVSLPNKDNNGCDVLLLPTERHGPRTMKVAIEVERSIAQYFIDHFNNDTASN